MKLLFKLSPYKVFLITFLIITIPLLVFPINLFPGIIVFGNSIKQEVPLSLSYFIGMGYDKQDLEALKITDYYLTNQGIALAFIFTLGIPTLFTYGSFVYRKG